MNKDYKEYLEEEIESEIYREKKQFLENQERYKGFRCFKIKSKEILY